MPDLMQYVRLGEPFQARIPDFNPHQDKTSHVSINDDFSYRFSMALAGFVLNRMAVEIISTIAIVKET